MNSNPQLMRHWERTGQAKIAVKCESEEELLILQATAKSLGICARPIHDAGRTQVAAGSITVLGSKSFRFLFSFTFRLIFSYSLFFSSVGPAPVRLINQVTSHLKLL